LYLVLHERDEGAHDEGGAAAGKAGELVAKGFAGAGGHDEENVVAGGYGLAGLLLVGAEAGEAEGASEERREGARGRGRGRGREKETER
jgi:hypothetical protein